MGFFAIDGEGTVRHPLLRPGTVRARDYQLDLAESAAREGHLVVVPTGLGKTVIAALAAADVLLSAPATARVLVVAPTRPLVHQHARAFRSMLAVDAAAVVTLTGEMPPEKRAAAFNAARVVVSTPQGLANDVDAGRVHLAHVALLVVDEAHRAVGDYAYVPLTRAYREARPHPRVLGLTASPGGDAKRVREVVANLGVARVTGRNHDHPDVAPYVPGLHVEAHSVRLDADLTAARDHLTQAYDARIGTLRKMGFLKHVTGRVSKRALLETGAGIQKRLRSGKSGFLFGALHHQLVAVQTQHALELLETQGLEAVRAYLERLDGEDRRASKAFLKDARVQEARALLDRAREHPKERALLDVLDAHKPERAIVFAQYRDTVHAIARRLNAHGWHAAALVGQAARSDEDPGLKQDAQVATLRAFADGEVDVLVATSIGEEGLDVPDVELVVFHEAVPSEIRAIQRRGRTGRTRFGRVVVLVTEGTRDMRALASAAEREGRMTRLVAGMG